ncbi:alpha/beta fold hydrolase [Flagellimonas allohymeniacidonis]|uniref:Alpha/beta fold hydrolase n=1 Tax=Flagellimonas allohymeniacidonis TaxID=2517819 RepID=A0A4Q8QG79_9FLAO|nr:alpha/beta fold hydrolase [Allomuricauda hymeniacidonis]TAI49562.1 alpha/beta fold hydrolase [Allomuricauda hymeniacidonis]
MTKLEVTTNLGHVIVATGYGQQNCKDILVIVPATGVKQSFYSAFASYMAEKGMWVLTFDYLGIGESLRSPIAQVRCNAQEWGSADLEGVLSFVRATNSDGRLCILGHSIGGQLIGLAPTARKASCIVLIGAQCGYWKFWTGLSRAKMLFNWYLLLPTLTSLFGYFPSKHILGMENLPKRMALQWRYWCTLPNYILDDVPQSHCFYKEIEAELLVFSMERDAFAPIASVACLAGWFGSKKRKHVHIRDQDYQVGHIGHFGIFKERKGETLWPILARQIQLS